MTRGTTEDDRRDDRGSVVVTGTSTGIGAATVSRLATLGFHVFAGVRRRGRDVARQHAFRRGGEPGHVDGVLGRLHAQERADERYFDVRLPRPNLEVDFAEQARSFAYELADRTPSLSAAEPGRYRDATR